MAFNRSQFNLTPYNVQSDLVKYLQVSGNEEVSAFIGSALEYYPLAIGNERVNNTVEGMNARFISGSGSEVISENVAKAELSVILFPHFEENITAETTLAAEINALVSGLEQVDESIAASANIYLSIDALETISNSAELSAEISPVVSGYELVSESASIENVDMKTCVLTLTLKPGQTLIIDANNYNVLLDNQNAIEVQSGDWIDDLNRNTTDITISAASGLANLSASILYTERYL